jgi:hypothetical protein
MHHSVRLFALTWTALCLATPLARAAADDPLWIPVILEDATSDQTLSVLNAVGTALRTREKVSLLDPAIAARTFESVHSAPAVEVDDKELRELGDGFRRALEAAAVGQWDRAYELVRNFDALSQPVQDYVTWRLNLSRDIFDYCLMSVHFMLQAGREAAARDEMRNCINTAPDRTLSARDAAENVIQLHTEVKTELLAQGEASLDVDASDAPASAAGCVVIVNGQPKGSLPFRETGLLPVPTRIQLNCQRPGRIYLLQLRPGRNSLIVDRRFEQVVHTVGHLGLRYGDAREETRLQVRDGLSIAKLLGGSDLLIGRRLDDGRMRLSRIGTRLERMVSEVTLAAKPSTEEITAAAHALATSRSAEIALEESGSPSLQDKRTERNLFAPLALLTGSAASFALAWISYGQSAHYRNDVVSQPACAADVLCIQSFAHQQTLGDRAVLFGALGSALGTASVPSLLSDTDGVPLWSWLTGIAGLGVASAGVVLWSQGQACTLEHCKDGAGPQLGQVLLLHGPPLLAVPITYAVRSLLKSKRVEAQAAYTPGVGGQIALQGAF